MLRSIVRCGLPFLIFCAGWLLSANAWASLPKPFSFRPESAAPQVGAENHLIKRGSDTITYDHEGNRARKTVSGVTTYYLLDDRNPSGYVQVLAEYLNPSNPPTRAYTYGHDLIAQRLNTGTASAPVWQTSYYGYDGHGSVRLLLSAATGAATTITDTYDYDAYGQLLAKTGTTPNHYRYTGEQWDSDLGMYYLRARYLNPNTGRFWTMDSYEGSSQDPLTLHKYLYCRASPNNRLDPGGHSSFGDVMITMQVKAYLFMASGSAVAKALATTIATLNVVAFVSDPGMYMSLGPIGAPDILAADVATLVRAGGKLFSATRSAIAARDASKILAGWRTDMRIPQVGQPGGDDVTTSLLEIHDGMWIGSRFKGRSPNDPTTLHPSLRPNAITRQHAEADAFNLAAWEGRTAEKATLTVDRNLCGACGRSGGVKSMAKALGIKELTVVTPAGTEVIVIDASVLSATGPVSPYGLINAALTAELGN